MRPHRPRPLAALTFALIVFLTLFAVGRACAQPRPQPIRRHEFPIEPAATDTTGCSWERTIVSGEVLSVRLANIPPHADGSPAAIITAGPTGTANLLLVTIAPDTGCGSSGCRLGNDYLVKLRATDSAGNHPICNVIVQVRQEVM